MSSILPNILSSIQTDNCYIHPDNSKEKWKSTLQWTQMQCDSLGVKFVNGVLKDIVADLNVDLPEDTERILLPNITISLNTTPNSNITKAQMKFYNRVIQVSKFIDEPPVDSVMNDLLIYTDYEGGNKIHLRPRPKLHYNILQYDVTSEPDYAAYIDDIGINKYMLVVEDKSPVRSIKTIEYQLCGEMIIAVSLRADHIMKDHIMYGITMKGVNIRFYRVLFTQDYLTLLLNKNSTINKKKLNILRYPPDNEEPLCIVHPGDREKIILIMCKIRSDIENMI
ncbi:hypothetical protein HDU92_008460 [Lobulomyces angularis]|nr:hypothetical protein HDU92_008460 [Lobulomyces angularis]